MHNLSLIQCQRHLPERLLRQRQCFLRLILAFAEDQKIVGKTDQPKALPLQRLIEFVEEKIGQDRRDGRPLRDPPIQPEDILSIPNLGLD